jgi:hypothetical protein
VAAAVSCGRWDDAGGATAAAATAGISGFIFEAISVVRRTAAGSAELPVVHDGYCGTRVHQVDQLLLPLMLLGGL